MNFQNNTLQTSQSLNCNGTLIDLSIPKVMGILNLTPNSFYDGGHFTNHDQVLHQVDKMLQEGATFIDIGAYSSKPNAEFVSEMDEINRLKPFLKHIIKEFPEILVSIDTFRSRVAQFAVENGACMVNDIAAGTLDDKMFETMAHLQVPYIMMHTRGTPQNMQNLTHYNHLIKEINEYFSEKISKAKQHGITDIVIDPGFGFAKTLQQNYHLMQHLSLLNIHDLPILVGISRKSMIYKLLETTPTQALNGTTVLHTIALQKQAKILRVHDVKEAIECIKIVQCLT